MAHKVIVRMKGGLGNQLFCYAAGRRLAIANDAELVIDAVSGFTHDRQYRRQYALEKFNISARMATAAERLEPLGRYRRAFVSWRNRRRPFIQRYYVFQEGVDFDSRLLQLRICRTVYLDGLWQSESYFKDIEAVVRGDLQIDSPKDAANAQAADNIRNSDSVALHVRWFNDPQQSQTHNATLDYYLRAMASLERQVRSPQYFVFSDDPVAARNKLGLTDDRAHVMNHNRGDNMAYADLWLMSQCKHFIIANSTFSWWGAWLSSSKDKIVVAPAMRRDHLAAWGFDGLIPSSWLQA